MTTDGMHMEHLIVIHIWYDFFVWQLDLLGPKHRAKTSEFHKGFSESRLLDYCLSCCHLTR